MAITLEERGRRVYLLGDTYRIRERIKEAGGHWDGEEKAWWLASANKAKAETLVAELNNAPAGNGGGAGGEKTPENPDEIRLCGKARYKGRTYYARYIGQTTKGWAAKLISYDGRVEFWAPCVPPGEEQPSGDDQGTADEKPLCRIEKRYTPREYRGVTQYTTLGSIRAYVEGQKQAEAEGRPPCAACGKRGHLIVDDEDGLMKCRSCCDLPSE